MSQATSATSNEQEYQGIRLPLDWLIEWVAERVGGSKSKEVVRFLKFGFVGTLGAFIDLGVSNLIFVTLLPAANELGEPILINTLVASTISFTLAILSNFFWNRYWTYPDSRTRPLGQQLMLFAFICTVGWIGRIIWLTFATDPLTEFVLNSTGLEGELAGQAGSSLAIFFGIFVVMIWNFVVNRYWTFNDVE
ncbi:MAG: GtrA family protein [Phototrophicaceae bacterium]